MFVSLRAVAALGVIIAQVYAIPKVTRTGRYLYSEDGNRFYIKGIGYQPQGRVEQADDNPFGEPIDFIDPLADTDGCRRDVPILQQAGINAIRVYSVHTAENHDACMKLLSDAGIYVILDLSTPPNGSIVRDQPTWSTNLLNSYIKTIDIFKGYDNVLSYGVGNEVVTTNYTNPAPFVKAAARDTKAYLKSIGSDALVGYSAINGPEAFRVAVADYLTCDVDGKNSDASSIDLFGLNEYTWCGDASFESSGYPGTIEQFANLQVVAYFSEYGCIFRPPRLWTEVDSLFGPQMSAVWSGGIAFSYFGAESNQGQFGMVTISEDGKSTNPSEDFTRLSTHYNAITPPNTPLQSAAVASTYGSCASSATTLKVSTKIPATPDEAACSCLNNGISCQFVPPIPEYDKINGEVITAGCELLGGVGLTCDEIGSDGATGVYGRVSGCDPTIKASYVMSLYYESQKRDQEACGFQGNGTVNSRSTATSTADDVSGSCIANPNSVFTPGSPTTQTNVSGSGKVPTPSGQSNDPGAGVSLIANHGLAGISAVTGITILTALWSLI